MSPDTHKPQAPPFPPPPSTKTLAVSDLCLTSCFLFPPQLLQRRDVTRTPRAHSSVLHQREPRALAAQRLPLRRPAGCTAVCLTVTPCLSTSCVLLPIRLLPVWPLSLQLPVWLLPLPLLVSHQLCGYFLPLSASGLLPVCHCLLPVALFCLWLLPGKLPVRGYFQCYFLCGYSLFRSLCLSGCVATSCLVYFPCATLCPWLLPVYSFVATSCVSGLCVLLQESTDWQWRQAMDYLSAVSELNYMTQIVIMLYEDNDKVGGALL